MRLPPLVRVAAPPAAQALDRRAERDRGGGGQRPDDRRPLVGALLDRDPEDVRHDHWKISVVQSPPCSRTSCARAGPPGRSWKSTKNRSSSSMPPSGPQLTRSIQERSPG